MFRTVNDLIEALQDMVNEHPEAGELPLRIAHQPSYPLQEAVTNVTVAKVQGRDGEPNKTVLFFVAGTCPYDENPYASSNLWEPNDKSLAEQFGCRVDVDEAFDIAWKHLGQPEDWDPDIIDDGEGWVVTSNMGSDAVTVRVSYGGEVVDDMEG